MRFKSNHRKAINHINGNLQIIACAGSDNTETISGRIASIILSNVPKEQILPFRSTEKAANEMKLRIRQDFWKANY